MIARGARVQPHRPRSGRRSHAFCSFLPVALTLACVAASGVAGCGTASPRYRTPERQAQTAPPVHDEDETRFATKIREEEAREDDRKVDVDAVTAGVAPIPESAGLTPPAPPGIDRDRVLLDVVSYLGTPYRHGGATKGGIDCSGFTSRVYTETLRLQLPRSTTEQFQSGAGVSRDQLQFGDLVFFNTTGRVPSHVGIFIEDDLFAHASVTQGVTISSLQSTYFKKRFVGARRIVPDSTR
jgi:lipoprotein Spr